MCLLPPQAGKVGDQKHDLHVAAIRTTDSILMGGDSAESNGNLVRIISSPKVFLKADYILGARVPPLSRKSYSTNSTHRPSAGKWAGTRSWFGFLSKN